MTCTSFDPIERMFEALRVFEPFLRARVIGDHFSGLVPVWVLEALLFEHFRDVWLIPETRFDTREIAAKEIPLMGIVDGALLHGCFSRSPGSSEIGRG
jgi:hypothetical protein